MVAGDPKHHGTEAHDDGDEPFLSRWVRRKSESRSTPAEAPSASEDVPAAGEPEPPVLTDADMPPLESLTEGSDFSPFMSPGVSDELRRHALRKLFGATRFNVRDGLDDYDDDYRHFGSLAREVAERIRERIGMVRPEPDDVAEGESAGADVQSVPDAEHSGVAVADDDAAPDDGAGRKCADDAADFSTSKG